MEDYIRNGGELLGVLIAKYPYHFAAPPICAFCFFFFPFLDSFNHLFREPSAIGSSKLFIPTNSISENEKKRIEKLFPYGIYFSDRTFLSPNLRIVSLETNSGSIMDLKFIDFYRNLRNQLELLAANYNGDMISYSSLCSKESSGKNYCFPDIFLLSQSYIALSQPVRYPIWHISIYNTSQFIFTGSIFGNTQTDSYSGRILSAQCVRMIFNFPPPYHVSIYDDLWDQFIHNATKHHQSNIRITHWSQSQYERDMKLIAERTRGLLPLLIFSLILFFTLSSAKYQCNPRTVLLSLHGVLSAACAVITAFGLLHIIGVRLVQIALITPFLVLSIGIDDVFIMLSVWQRISDVSDVCDIMRITFRESIVSILLTTVGNVLVFTLGIFSPFPIIRTFCIYCAVSLFVVFLFQLTLFGSLLVKANQRASESVTKNLPIQQKCSLSDGETNFSVKSVCSFQPLSLIYEAFINNKYFIALISISYLIYLVGSIIILNQRIDIGLQLSSLLPDDTDTYKYLKIYEEYFSEYSSPMEVVLADNLDYFNRHVQRRIMRALSILENTTYTMQSFFWLPAFLDFIGSKNYIGQFNNSLVIEKQLKHFLQHPAYRHFSDDLVLLEQNNRLHIKSSRLQIPLRNITRLNRSKAMHLIRSKVKVAEAHYSIRFLTYHVVFDLAEQDDLIPQLTFSNAALAGIASTLATLLIIPSVLNCLLMIWATLSINIGVLSLLSLCDTRLDIISTIVILLSIGYSVDFSSHILAHYHHFKRYSTDPVGKTLSIVGWPIIQSSISTMIGVLCVSPVKGYIVRTFVRGVLFVCCIGLYHSIIVLPAFLQIIAYSAAPTIPMMLKDGKEDRREKTDKYSVERSKFSQTKEMQARMRSKFSQSKGMQARMQLLPALRHHNLK